MQKLYNPNLMFSYIAGVAKWLNAQDLRCRLFVRTDSETRL